MHHGRLYVARHWFRTTTAVVRPPARRSPCYGRLGLILCGVVWEETGNSPRLSGRLPPNMFVQPERRLPIFIITPPRLTLLKVMAQGATMKNFGGNEMFAVFDLLKIRNSRR
jgi:hypothetical protein